MHDHPSHEKRRSGRHGRRLLGVVLGLSVAGVTAIPGGRAARADGKGRAPTLPAPAAIHGRGGWHARGVERTQRWQLDVRRGPGAAIRGRLAIDGSALFSAGNVEGSLDGPRLNGSVIDDTGRLLATFAGTVSPSGAATGTYLDASGETGAWATDGTPLRGVAATLEPPGALLPNPAAAISEEGTTTIPAVTAAAVRARGAALAAVPHPPDHRRGTLVVIPEEPAAPPRFDSGAPDPDRLEPAALPPRRAARGSR